MLERLHIIKSTLATAEKKPLHLSIPYLGQSQNKKCYENRVPYDLVSGVVYEWTCGRCGRILPIMERKKGRHLKFRSGKHIGISPFTFKKAQPSQESSICEHLLQCDNSTSFDEFTILAHGSKKYLLEIQESYLIKPNQPVLNQNISYPTVHLFDTV